jgi:ribosomal protein S18 acetylase RimI-like enzyme
MNVDEGCFNCAGYRCCHDVSIPVQSGGFYMLIRIAREEDAPAMGRVMVDTYLAAHRDQIPAEVWAKRAQEWTYEVSEQGWAQTLREIAADSNSQECIYVAEEPGTGLVGLVMCGPAKTDLLPQSGEIYALYVRASHQRRGLGQRLIQAVAAHQAQLGISALQIGCLAANVPARRFYESLGGRLVDQRLFDEEGIMLPEVVYGWADIKALVAMGSIGSKERRVPPI